MTLANPPAVRGMMMLLAERKEKKIGLAIEKVLSLHTNPCEMKDQ